MKKKLKWILVVVAAVIVLSAVLLNSPQFRTKLFVGLYADDVEHGLSIGAGVPADDAVFLGYKSINSWEGEHGMTEFIIIARGDTYYGCYYSPDDVPLAFQNVDVELIPDGENKWTWTAEGDNHGATSKMKEHWYYFAASF